MSKLILFFKKMQVSKSKMILRSSIIGFLFLFFLSFKFINYINNTNYFNQISITAIEKNGQLNSNVIVYGVTPTNKTIILDSDGSTTIWDNTFGLFHSFHIQSKTQNLDSIAYFKIIITNKTNKYSSNQINDLNSIKDKEIQIKDSAFLNFSNTEKLFAVSIRLFKSIFQTYFLYIILFLVLFFTIFVRKKPNIILLKVLISLIVLSFILIKGGLIHTDTKSYLEFGMQRPLIYPIFLYFFDTIWSSHLPIIMACGLFGLISAHLLSKKINSVFLTPKLAEVVFFLILLLPYVFNEYLVANFLIAESISYPLFLMFVYYLIRVLESNYQKSTIIKLFIFSNLLILTRGQFVIIYPALIILGIYPLIFKTKTKFFFIISIVITFLLSNTIDSTYHLAIHGKFEKTNFGGFMLSGNALYSSLPSDSSLFENAEKEIFINISKNIDENKLRHTFVSQESDLFRFFHFFESFDDIIWRKGVGPGFDKYIESIEKTSQNHNSYFDTIQSIHSIIKTINKDKTNDFYALYLIFENKINSEIKKEYFKIFKRPTTKDYLSSDESFYFKTLKIKNLNSYIEPDKFNDEQFNWNNRNKILLKISLKLIAFNFTKSFNTAYLNLKEGYYNPKMGHLEYLICIILSILFLILFLRKKNKYVLIPLIIIVIHLTNLTLISYTALMLGRYIFYTKYVLITILIAFLISVICPLKCFAVFKESDKWKQAPPQQ